MTAFQVGDVVESRVAAQGLCPGAHYVVRAVESTPTPFGTFVTYELEDGGGLVLPVDNGHLVLGLFRRASGE